MAYLFSFFLTLITAIVISIFFDSFFSRRKFLYPFFLNILIYALICTLIINITPNVPGLRQFISVLSTFLMAIILYEATFVKSVLMSVLISAILYLIDISSSFLLVATSEKTICQLQKGYASFLIGAGISHILQLVFVIVVRKVKAANARTVSLSYKEWLRLLLFPLVSALVLVALFNDAVYRDETTPLMFMSVIGLLVANITIIYIVDVLEFEQQSREENRILQQQVKIETNNVEALIEYNTTQRQIAHDHVNHLNTLHALLTRGKLDDAKQYVSNLCGNVSETQYIIHTNNPVADAVLNLKYLLAKKYNISMQFDVDDLSQFPLCNEELATVLSNALDNAIEACRTVKSNPKIKVKIRCTPCESMISIVNTTAQPVEIINNTIKSTKAQKELHGYGLKNIEMVLAKNEFDYALGYEDGMFQFTAIL